MHGSVSCLSYTSSASAIKVEFVRVFCILSVPIALPSWTYLSVLIRNNAWPVCKYEIHKITRTFCRPGSVKLKCECSNLVPGVQASPVSVCQLLSRDNCNNCNIRRAQGGGGHSGHAFERGSSLSREAGNSALFTHPVIQNCRSYTNNLAIRDLHSLHDFLMRVRVQN